MSDLSPVPVKAPFFRRLWVVVLMTCLLIPMPAAMVILLTGPVYRKKADGWQPISDKARYIYGGALVVWLIAATLKAFLQPGGIQGEWERSADPALTKSAQRAAIQTASDPGQPEASTASDDNGLPTCDNPEVIQTAREAIDESPAGVTTGLRVRDVGKGQETLYQPERPLRRCVAEAMLNNGPSLMTFQVFNGPSGSLMVQSQVGDTAMMQYEVDKARRDEARAAAPPPAKSSMEAVPEAKAAAIEDNYSAGYHKCMSTGEASQGVTSAMVECIGNELKLQDGKLNAAYKTTMASLDPAGQTNLRTTQRAWIKNRDAKCEEENQSGGTMDQIGRPSCHLDLTVRRTQELEKMRGN